MFLKFQLKSPELSLFKDVTIRLGWAGVKGKSDDVILYGVFFYFEGVPYKVVPGFAIIFCDFHVLQLVSAL